MTWWPQSGSRRIEIRAEVADKAGTATSRIAQSISPPRLLRHKTPSDQTASAADNPFYLAQNPGPPGPPSAPFFNAPAGESSPRPSQGAAPVVAPTTRLCTQYVARRRSRLPSFAITGGDGGGATADSFSQFAFV